MLFRSRYGFWTPTGAIKSKLKHTYHFDSWNGSSGDICLSIEAMIYNKIDYENDILTILKANNIKYKIVTTGPNKWVVIKKGDYIKRNTKRN